MSKCLRCGAGSEWIQGKVPKELPKEPLSEPEGMDDVFSKICELISIGQKGEAKKILKQASTRSEGWATDEDVFEMMKFHLEMTDLSESDNNWFREMVNKTITDYKLKKGAK